MSDAIKALVKAQQAMGPAVKNARNPHLKSAYADLGSVMEACFDALHANGFAVMQPGGADEFGPYVETIFAHESGETFRSRCYLVIGKQDMQGVGSAWTYARRYGLLGMAGLAPEDDDGEATKRAPRQESPRQQAPQEKPAERDPRKIADALIAQLGKVQTYGELQALRAEGTKFSEAWDWLTMEKPPMAGEVKKAEAEAEARVDPARQAPGRAA